MTTTPESVPQEPAPLQIVGRPARITVVETVYHQNDGEQPTAVESRFLRWLDTREQVYLRRFQVGVSWQALDWGWLEQAGFLVLRNDEGQPLGYGLPTLEERAVTTAATVEVASLVAATRKPRDMHSPPLEMVVWGLLLPGESLRVQPADITAVRLRCRTGLARCTVHLFPR